VRGAARSAAAEPDLVEAALAGQEWARRELYARHAEDVLAVARSRLGCDALAEDAAQEAWLRAFAALPKFRGEAAFATWIHRIAVNAAHRMRDRRQHWDDVHRALPERFPAAAPPRRPLLRSRLAHAVQELPPGMRRVLVLRASGYTHAEIARRLGTSEGTSKSQLSCARQRLSDTLRDEFGPKGSRRMT
jgi:RNA polymerase sigma-70 factor (ECF subfamily)